MKLKTFHKENTVVSGKGSLPTISFCVKTGVIKISARAVADMGLKTGQVIAISQDEDSPNDWYLHDEEKGFALLIKGNSKRSKIASLGFSSKDICRKILDCTEFKLDHDKTIQMNLDTEATKHQDRYLYAIATSTARLALGKKKGHE